MFAGPLLHPRHSFHECILWTQGHTEVKPWDQLGSTPAESICIHTKSEWGFIPAARTGQAWHDQPCSGGITHLSLYYPIMPPVPGRDTRCVEHFWVVLALTQLPVGENGISGWKESPSVVWSLTVRRPRSISTSTSALLRWDCEPQRKAFPHSHSVPCSLAN